MASNPPPHTLRWSDDDDDGTLDVHDITALKARLEEANLAGVPTPLSSKVAPLASAPTPLALKTHLVIRSHPVAQVTALETKPRVHIETQPTRSENALPTTWHGVPLLIEDNAATSSFVDAKKWNLFAVNVTEEAAPQAAFLFRELERRSADAKA
jgi:hypothetical protein